MYQCLCRCHALLPTGAGPVLTGSSDCCIRLWDAAYPQQSYIVAGPPATATPIASAASTAAEQPVSYKYWQHTVQQVSVIDEVSRPTVATAGGQQASLLPAHTNVAFAQCHRDTVKCLLQLEASDKLLLSSSQDGVIKAWK